jgi:lysozyme
MKTASAGFDIILKFEGLHDGDLKQIGLQPKMDPIGIWTEGYGRAMRDKKGNFIRHAEGKKLAYANITIHTVKEALEALKSDLSTYEAIVSKKIKIPLTQNQFDALVSYTYNTGGSSTLFKYINTYQGVDKIYQWFTTKYITADGVALRGLVLRRKSEADLFFTK